jgi:GT2 family glycosyltransferase
VVAGALAVLHDAHVDAIAVGCPLPNVGVVVIGRNEGERLRNCLASVVETGRATVYVDSASTDRSVQIACAMAVAVVELDMSIPFTPGRARNEGFRRLRELVPDLAYVQFVDGDCEIVAGWIEKAAAFLDSHPDVAVVSGRRRERYPERSIYNTLMAIEWDTHPVGEAQACGGDALMRVDVFAAMNGYHADLMAGEEPELCIRMRGAGWRIWGLDEHLTWHDAGMTQFGQWWKRAMRGGFSVAQGAFLLARGAALQGAAPEEYRSVRRLLIRQLLGSWFWALALPLAAFALALGWSWWALLLLLLYPLHIVRRTMRGAYGLRTNWWHAVFQVLFNFAYVLGQLRYLTDRCCRRQPHLIEYKS